MKTLVLISLLAFLVGTVTNAATTDEAQAKDKAVDVSDERFEDDLREATALGDDEEDEAADEEEEEGEEDEEDEEDEDDLEGEDDLESEDSVNDEDYDDEEDPER